MTFSTVRRSTSREWSKPDRTSTSVLSLASEPRRGSGGVFWPSIPLTFWVSSMFEISSAILDIQVFHKFSIGLYEVLAQLHFGAHQLVEDGVGFLGVFHLNLYQHPLLGVHGGVEQLRGV